jgi:hypothetical protein
LDGKLKMRLLGARKKQAWTVRPALQFHALRAGNAGVELKRNFLRKAGFRLMILLPLFGCSEVIET